ncbi:hypothetical protein DE146DRAFT_761816 [Phaeosphaeria sp. MPI-PUGE-AT-0046c]|nr:hypothetical protein DE146DRAFT_761816 [Phaeosphaeria sp. MPI-PUGE-AT-0046c]
MLSIFGLAFVLSVYHADAMAVTSVRTTSAEPKPLVRRTAVPTFLLRPYDQYLPSQTSNPEPSGTSLKIYPTGIYDEFPPEEITIALGPELRDRIKDAASKSCNSQGLTQECQDTLMATLPQTDLSAHTKRFITFAVAGTIAAFSLILGLILETSRIQSTDQAMPVNIRIQPGDIVKVNSMVSAGTFVAVMAGPSPTPVTMTVPTVPTPTWPDSIVIETMSSDKDDHKAGDVVYHIPKDAAGRISDFLAMTGIQETQKICQDQRIKRADGLQECLRLIQRHAIDLADGGPANLLQVAQQNIPARPGAGQAIGLPIENLAAEGITLIIPVYRVIFEHAPRRSDLDMGWDPVVLARSAVAVAIAAHAVMFVGDSLLDIWIPKDKIIADLKEDKLMCPKDMLCIADECKGQEEQAINSRDDVSYCKKATNFGCKCSKVNYGYSFEVESDYMDKQYEWLEELIKESSKPIFDPRCWNNEQEYADAAKKIKE